MTDYNKISYNKMKKLIRKSVASGINKQFQNKLVAI